MNDEEKTKIENLRLEYQLTQDMAMHYDTLNWTIGTILIAGVFGMIGLSKDDINKYGVIAVLAFFILLIWRLYYKRHKRIQKLKFKRLQEIEKILDLKQHGLINNLDNKEKIFWFKGDDCADAILYGIPSIILSYYFWKTGKHLEATRLIPTAILIYIWIRYRAKRKRVEEKKEGIFY